MGLSVGIITWNEARRIERTLEALRGWPNEIIVFDSGSTDGTPDICRRFGARVIETDWPGYGVQKNRVLAECGEEWILQIDADEVVTPELRREIDTIMRDPRAADVYWIPREDVIYGRKLRHFEWHGRHSIRLFRRGTGRWTEVEVHEGYKTDRPIGRLKNPIEHHTYIDRAQQLWKLERYTSLEAEKALRQGERPRLCYSIARAVYGFLRLYVWKRGFLDGLIGLELALQWAQSIYLADRKLARLYAAKRAQSMSR